jgi:hypothetical protein
MGEELDEILQNSSNEEYTENKHSKGCNVEIDEKADEAAESALQGENDGRKKQEVPTASCTINQTFSCKSGIEWREKASLVMKKKTGQFQKWYNYLTVRKCWKNFALFTPLRYSRGEAV